MFKRVLLFGSLLVLLVCCSTTTQTSSTQPESPKERFRQGFQNCTVDNDLYPSVVALHTDIGFIGSGVLLAPRHVLTAGHCIENMDIVEVRQLNGKSTCVEKLILHPQYKIGHIVLNDIGIIILTEPILDVHIWPLCPNDLALYKYQNIDLSGYGGMWKKQSEYGKFAFYGILIHEINEFKILPIEGSVWFGDSGGGAFAEVFGTKCLIGIISNFEVKEINGKRVIIENSCVRVDVYSDWIRDVIGI